MKDYKLAYLAAGISSILLLMFFLSVFVVKRREKKQAAMSTIKSFDEDFTIQTTPSIAESYTGSLPPPYSPRTSDSFDKSSKWPFEKDTVVDLNEIKTETASYCHKSEDLHASQPIRNEIDQLKEGESNGIEIIMNGSNLLTEDDRALSSPTLMEDSDDLFEYEAPARMPNRRRRSSSLDAIASPNKFDDLSGTALTSSSKRWSSNIDGMIRRLESVTSIHSIEMLDESSASESQPLERRPSLSDSEVPSRNNKVSLRRGQQGEADGDDLDVYEETKSF